MRNPRPYAVFQNGRLLFVIHAYSLMQARQLVEARIGDTVAVVIAAAKRSKQQ